jgi:hypothetical protein
LVSCGEKEGLYGFKEGDVYLLQISLYSDFDKYSDPLIVKVTGVGADYIETKEISFDNNGGFLWKKPKKWVKSDIDYTIRNFKIERVWYPFNEFYEWKGSSDYHDWVDECNDNGGVF